MEADRAHAATGRSWWSRLWEAWSGGPVVGQPDPEVARVLGYARRPAFTPAVADLLVGGLSPAQLDALWRATTRELADAVPPTTRLGMALIRAQILDRLESEVPEDFKAWFAEQWRSSSGLRL